MIANVARLREKAHELALTHRPLYEKPSHRPFRRMSEADVREIRRYLAELAGCREGCAEPAEQWLRDHAEFILEQAQLAELAVREARIGRLPRLGGNRKIRMIVLCEAFLELTDGELDEEALCLFLRAYQEIAVLTMAELWLMPLGLRIVLVRRLRTLMAEIAERRTDCAAADWLLRHLDPARMDAGQLVRALEETGLAQPLSGRFAAHLIRHLREWSGDASAVREWLSCTYENGTADLDRIVSYEHKLQAAAHLSVGRIIGSLRLLVRMDWRSRFAEVSMAEQALQQDPAGDYPRLDHASRDLIRRQTEQLARRFRVPETRVVEAAIELAEAAGRKPDRPELRTENKSDRTGHRAENETDGRGHRAPIEPDGMAPSPAGSPNGPGTVNHETDGSGEAGGSPDETAETKPRESFLFYYLLEPAGIEKLRRSLRKCGETKAMAGQWPWTKPTLVYFAWTGSFFLLALAGMLAWMARGHADAAGGLYAVPGAAADWPGTWLWLAAAAILAYPASELAVSLTHGLIGVCRRATPLLKYHFPDGIPADAATVVAVPVVLSGPSDAAEMADRLELHYLANRSDNLHFALLADLPDAAAETMPEDEGIVAEARKQISRLNERYPNRPFHLYVRRRVYHETEGCWMGWERKRGKLVEFVSYAGGKGDPGYLLAVGDRRFLRTARYLITLDADTELPLECAKRMVGAMHLPYNRPRLNRTRTRVVEGYGVMQPRIGIRHETALRSRLAFLWSRETGMDPYAFAVSDPYQDLLGQGIYVGKGILDMALFAELLADRIPDNRVLSHDLLEGGFLRAGLLSDIELIDGLPGTFHAHQKRLHRWVRGDWQLLLWLLPKNRDRTGRLRKVDLPAILRWQIFDNMRRSLAAPVLVLALLLGMRVLPGAPGQWLAVVLGTVFLPVLRQLAAGNWRGLGLMAGQCLLAALTLPYQAVLMADAICRTLYRLLISRRRLLEWVSMAEVEKAHSRRRMPPVAGLAGGLAVAGLLAVSVPRDFGPAAVTVLLVICWSLAPAVIRFLDQPLAAKPDPGFSRSDKEQLYRLARDIWAFFDRYVTADDHWLPPDNVQLDPPRGTARRTSPTNIGLYMASVMVARDFGFIGRQEAIERLDATLSTLERMEKWEGHLFNWYDTETLDPLPPRYVSTVDSGNLVVSLLAVRQGVAEWMETDKTVPAPAGDSWRKDAEEADRFRVAFSEELAAPAGERWRRLAEQLIRRMDAFIRATDFRPLYDHRSRLFSLGFFPEAGRRDGILYDLLASEARLASFAAIALGQVSVDHWHALGRSMARVSGRPLLLSWSGTMFEYMMPWLFMRTWRRTVWDATLRAAVEGQFAHAKKRGVPAGISESGYYAFDQQMNYQYQAFGVPELGFRKGLDKELVTAPYAAIMALPYAGRRALAALAEYDRMGARGQYGYYEAVDFTKKRLPAGSPYKLVASYMAHHQGMSLLTLANLLLPRTVADRFHANKEVRAAEWLLQERLPAKPRWVVRSPALILEPRDKDEPDGMADADRGFHSDRTLRPEVHLLAGDRYCVMVTASGGGYGMYNGLAVSRRREDPVLDSCSHGFYIRDPLSDRVWSPAFLPAMVPGEQTDIRFSPDRATFGRTDGGIRSEMTVFAAPDEPAEIRRLQLVNTGTAERLLEVTAYQELSLSGQMAEEAHPAFSKLFVQTAHVAELDALVAHRRPREAGGSPLWAAYGLFVEGGTVGEHPPEFETDRGMFIGRGHSPDNPAGLRARLRGTTGSVTDPAFVIRRRVELKPGEAVTLVAVTAVGGEREEALDVLRRYGSLRSVEHGLELAWHRSRTELRNVQLSPEEAVLAQRLAGLLLYAPEPDAGRQRYLAHNVKGQSGLWALGISGDRPIVVLAVTDLIRLPFVRKVIALHEYLRLRQLPFDLVLLHAPEEGYIREMRDVLRREAEHGVERFGVPSSGIHVLDEGSLSPEDKTLLLAAARLILHADGPSLGTQLRQGCEAAKAGRLPDRQQGRPDNRTRSEDQNQPEGRLSTAFAPESLLYDNGTGGFSPDGREYRMRLSVGRVPPAPWINVLANPSFGCLVSEQGAGYAWWKNSRECKLTPWSNDPVLDPPGEALYIRDEESGVYWRPAVADPTENTTVDVAHGWGYSRFSGVVRDIGHVMTVAVAKADPVKIIRLRITNNGSRQRKLSVTYYAEWVLGVRRDGNGAFLKTVWDGEAKALVTVNRYQEAFRDAHAFLAVYPERAGANGRDGGHGNENGNWSWTCDRLAFLGRYGDAGSPAAMASDRLDGRTGMASDPCGAVRSALVLEPGETTVVHVLLGCESSPDRVRALLARYADPDVCRREMDAVRQFWLDLTGRVTVTTPSRATDLLLNGWLLVQTLGCRMWARTAFYQAGGAFGYRDQLQDSLALLHADPALTRKQILLHAAHQYTEGDVQHWWHEETGRGIRTRFSDDLLWLPYAISRYVDHTGDGTILDEQAPYLFSEPLAEGEQERYEETVPAGETGTIYEHGCRAIDLALRRKGDNGLPLIGAGDWNDGMNLVGDEGRGVSVWLGFFLYDVLGRFARIARHKQDGERAARYETERKRLKLVLNTVGWDGAWFRRAMTDEGNWLGSAGSRECRIDAIAQSWAVLSDAGDPDKCELAMASLERELVDRDLSLIRLLTPPFSRTDPSPGYIQGYPPGIRENGAQYTHGVLWSIGAWSRLGRGDKAFDLFRLVNPVNHTRTDSEVRRYRGEPYVLAADVYTGEPHLGRAGWTWYTGAAGWMYQLGLEAILGIRMEAGKLHINPCIPPDWPGFAVQYRYGSTLWRIEVKNPDGRMTGIRRMVVDGEEARLEEGNGTKGAWLALGDDGASHAVELVM